jgi:hypothetical protein
MIEEHSGERITAVQASLILHTIVSINGTQGKAHWLHTAAQVAKIQVKGLLCCYVQI